MTKEAMKPTMNISLSNLNTFVLDHKIMPINKIKTLKLKSAVKVLFVGENPILSDVRCFVSMALKVIEIGTSIPIRIGIQTGMIATTFDPFSFIALSTPIKIVHKVMAIRPII